MLHFRVWVGSFHYIPIYYSAFQMLMSTFQFSSLLLHLQPPPIPAPLPPSCSKRNQIRIMHIVIVNKLYLESWNFLLSLECPMMHEHWHLLVIFPSRSLALLALFCKGRLHFLRYILCANTHSVLINSLKLSQALIWQWFLYLLHHLCFSIAKREWSRLYIKK